MVSSFFGKESEPDKAKRVEAAIDSTAAVFGSCAIVDEDWISIRGSLLSLGLPLRLVVEDFFPEDLGKSELTSLCGSGSFPLLLTLAKKFGRQSSDSATANECGQINADLNFAQEHLIDPPSSTIT